MGRRLNMRSASYIGRPIRRPVNKKKLAVKALRYFLLGLFALIYIFPIYCLIIRSITPDEYIYDGLSLIPKGVSLEAYIGIFNSEYLTYLLNTLFVCISNVLGVCLVSSFTAYGLCKVKMRGSGIIFAIIMSTVLLPSMVTAIPLFQIYSKLNWSRTLIPLWLPIWFGGGAMNIFLTRQFIRGIPNSLCEAAIIDGASSFKIYWSIILPLIKPILLFLAVNTFNGRWNDFQGPMSYIVTDDKSLRTLTLALYMNVQEGVLINKQMAMGVFMMIPGTVLFALFQNELMEGVSTTGLKG